MPPIDPVAVAVHAAGIADALVQTETQDTKARARFASVTENYGGHVGVMQQIAEAAEIMECFRVRHGATAAWGAGLPYLYDVWDAIAQGIWMRLGEDSLDEVVESAIRSTMSIEAA